MEMEDAFLQALHDSPAEDSSWLILADWLEEQGQAERAELARLHVEARQHRSPTEHKRAQQRTRELLGAGFRPGVPILTNSLSMEFVLIPPGSFLMGSRKNRNDHRPEEQPRREITITRPFYLGRFQVTQSQYEAVQGVNPSYFQPDHPHCQDIDAGTLPVETVAYVDITSFCRRLSALPREQQAGRRYRLPTEAEWEYACRAGSTSRYNVGDTLTYCEANFDGYSWEDDKADSLPTSGPVGRTTPVGSYPPNLFGLYDMHGNVWEWCKDWFDPGYYREGPTVDPPGPRRGYRRVLRGGGWSTPNDLCRSALRGHNTVTARHNYNGFRVVLEFRKRPRRSLQ
jgi:uncharacterized protein (TIGR02996 family)